MGLGGMGSAAAYHLARRGVKVLGVERYEVPHEFGSSHGETRIIRLAYFEHPDYVPLLRRAYELWRVLESGGRDTLLVTTGSLDAGVVGGDVFAGSLASCETHGIPHEVLSPVEVGKRYPGYRLQDDMMAVFQEDGGFLIPERCIQAHLEGAVRAGADVRTGERVTSWDETGSGVRVHMDRGSFEAGQLILAAGAWTGPLAGLSHLLTPERQVLLWVRPQRPGDYQPRRFPVFNIRGDLGHFYGFPADGAHGVKVGKYNHLREVVDPDLMDRSAGPQDESAIRAFIERVLPGANGPAAKMKVCLFTNTPDEHFIVDHLPGSDRVIVGAGFSGHGFKFACVIGEILADLATGKRPATDIGFLSAVRF